MSKFVKGYCAKTNRYFGLEMKEYGGTYKVSNFIEISKEDASVLSSQVIQRDYYSNTNLQACSKCGNRLVSGCDCAHDRRCKPGMPYKLECLYCSEMKIDLSRTRHDGSRKGRIRLSQGEEVEILDSAGNPLSKVKVGVGWDESKSGRSIDVDSSVVLKNKTNSINELVYFGNKINPSNSVIHHGDNVTGSGSGDDENIDVLLDKVPQDVTDIFFILNIYDCVERGQTFSIINNLFIRINDPDSGEELIKYDVVGNFDYNTGIIIAKAYRTMDGWSFKAIGKGTNDSNVGSLTSSCNSYL